MAFDFTIITQFHFWLFLLAFACVFLLIRLRVGKHKKIVRAGGELILIITALSWFVLGNHLLVVGLVLAGVLTFIVGRRDEVRPLSATIQLLAQVGIIGLLVLFGWRIGFLSNPFAGGVFFLPTSLSATSFLLWSPLVTFVFLLVMTNAMNWIDGIDGLAGSLCLSAFAVLIFISLLPTTQDAQTLGLATIGLGVTAAFLLWNISPAKAYLGTTGSWFLGLFIGLLAVAGGGKIATTLLVLAVPVLDALFVVAARFMKGKAIWQGDKQHHIHYRLTQRGLSQKEIVILLVSISALLGISAVLLQTHFKLLLFIFVSLVFAAFIIGLEIKEIKGK